ncbi:Membrane dipeptidase [Paenibacillus vortex V453]|uniref:Membrane dipeptidase n=1 Tax=Paenibacillus vortex V453 TaxID=715225 RepID=A0A2R9SRP9_9BACL|nr:membrane dipeptidase [Paenibacillus vortex]EFU40045.1 Membrane dipeptidase [Paenibacillus vortex V453]
MRTVDFHCDALSKMWEDPKASFVDDRHLDVTLQRMEEGDLALQVFAVFLSEKYGRPSFVAGTWRKSIRIAAAL